MIEAYVIEKEYIWWLCNKEYIFDVILYLF